VTAPDAFLVSPAGECEIVITRRFRAPRELVFDAYTRPDLVRRWLLGPPGWQMPVCEIDLRVGGHYRYVWRHEEGGQEMGMGGVFIEIASPGRLVATEKFDDAWYPGEAVGTLVLVEQGGHTLLTQTVRYQSGAARDIALKSGMDTGMEFGFNRLADLLATQAG
jgi:uncharacterized protein YndB with AHSA1/START domain